MSKANKTKLQKGIQGLLNAVNKNNSLVTKLINYGFTENTIDGLFGIKYIDFNNEINKAMPGTNLQYSGGDGFGEIPLPTGDQLAVIFSRVFGSGGRAAQSNFTTYLNSLGASAETINRMTSDEDEPNRGRAYTFAQYTIAEDNSRILLDLLSPLNASSAFGTINTPYTINNINTFLQRFTEVDTLKQAIKKDQALYNGAGYIAKYLSDNTQNYPTEWSRLTQAQRLKDLKDKLRQSIYDYLTSVNMNDPKQKAEMEEILNRLGLKITPGVMTGIQLKNIISSKPLDKRQDLFLLIMNLLFTVPTFKGQIEDIRAENPDIEPDKLLTKILNRITFMLGAGSGQSGEIFSPVLVPPDVYRIIIQSIKDFLGNRFGNESIIPGDYFSRESEGKEPPEENPIVKKNEVIVLYDILNEELTDSERAMLISTIGAVYYEMYGSRDSNTLTEDEANNFRSRVNDLFIEIKKVLNANPVLDAIKDVWARIKDFITTNKDIIKEIASTVLLPSPEKTKQIIDKILKDLRGENPIVNPAQEAQEGKIPPAQPVVQPAQPVVQPAQPLDQPRQVMAPYTPEQTFSSSESLSLNLNQQQQLDERFNIVNQQIIQRGINLLPGGNSATPPTDTKYDSSDYEESDYETSDEDPSAPLNERMKKLIRQIERFEMSDGKVRRLKKDRVEDDSIQNRAENPFARDTSYVDPNEPEPEQEEKKIPQRVTERSRLTESKQPSYSSVDPDQEEIISTATYLRNLSLSALRTIYNGIISVTGTDFRLTRNYSFTERDGTVRNFHNFMEAQQALQEYAPRPNNIYPPEYWSKIQTRYGVYRKVTGGGGGPPDGGDNGGDFIGGYRRGYRRNERFKGLTKQGWIRLVALMFLIYTGKVVISDLVKSGPLPEDTKGGTTAPGGTPGGKPTPGSGVLPGKYLKINHNELWDSVGLGGVIDIYNGFVDEYNDPKTSKADRAIADKMINDYWGKLSKATGVPELDELLKARQNYDDLRNQYENATNNGLSYNNIVGIYNALKNSSAYLDTMTQKYLGIENNIFKTVKNMLDPDVTIDDKDDPGSIITKMQTQVKSKAIVDPTSLILSKGMMERIARKLANQGDFSSGIMSETERFNNFSIVKNHEYPEGLGLDNPLIRRNKEYEINQYLNANPNPTPYKVPSYNTCVKMAKHEPVHLYNPIMIDNKLDDANWNPIGNQIKLKQPSVKSSLFYPENEIQKHSNKKKIETMNDMIRSGPYTGINVNPHHQGGTIQYNYNEKLNQYPLTSEFKQVKPTKVTRYVSKAKKSRIPDNYSIK